MIKVNIAVVDANYVQRKRTLLLLKEYTESTFLRCHIDWFNSGKGVIEEVSSRGDYHIYIIDPSLPDVNGIAVARKLRQRNESNVIIFTSYNKQDAINAFEVRALDYITKPIDEERFGQTLERAVNLIHKQEKKQLVEINLKHCVIRVPVDDILFIDIVDRALCFHMKDGQQHMTKCLREPFEMAVSDYLSLPWLTLAGTTRIINVEQIVSFTGNYAIMRNGDSFVVTHHRFPTVYRLWREYTL